MDAYLAALFEKYLVILAQRDAENDRCDILKTVDPFLPLASLPSNIKHTEGIG